jgi:uncharacterized membrane protein
MRPKLVIGASSLAALLGAGSCVAIVLSIFSSLQPVARPGLLVSATFLLPIAAITLASVFVYRHTARRRKLQALLTAILAILLTLTILALVSILSARRNTIGPPGPSSMPEHTSR